MPVPSPWPALALGILALGQSPAPLPKTAPVSTPGAEARTAARFEVIRRDPVALRGFLFAFPKGADLHNHLGGAVYAESYLTWAAERNLCIDVQARAFVEASEPATPAGVVCRNPATEQPAGDALGDPELYRTMVDAMSMRHHDASDGPGGNQFFDSFQKFGPVIRAETPGGDLTGKMMAEVVDRAARQQVQHVELMIGATDGRFGTIVQQLEWTGAGDMAAYRDRMLDAGLGISIAARRRWLDEAEATMRAALACGTATASAGCRTSVRYLASAARGQPPQVVFAQLMACFELADADPRVVGVNPVQPEDWYVARRDYDLHVRMFEFLHRLLSGCRRVAARRRAGFGQVPPEDLGWHVRRAVEIGVASRIGHGADVDDDPARTGLLREMARRRIAVEINLSSNDYILGLRGPRHPLRAYLRAGVPVVLTTDDEGVSRTDLTNEYQRAVEEHGVTYAELKRISRTGIEHSFLPDAQKARWLAGELEKAFAVFERMPR